MAADITSKSAMNREAFGTFAGGMAIQLPPERAALKDWVEGVATTAAKVA
ncbi:hypothetical protein VQ042_24285 [Aurantimonas sp. A2-1-M11]